MLLTTYIDFYRAVLRELDKYGSPSYEVADHNYFFNKAIQQYCNIKYNDFDTKQQSIDDLRALVTPLLVDDATPPFDGTLISYPPYINFTNLNTHFNIKYWHFLSCRVILEVTVPFSCYLLGQTFVVSPKKLTADAEQFIETNSYHCPSLERVYYKIDNSKIQFRFAKLNESPKVKIKEIHLEILKEPQVITLTNNLSNGATVGEFSSYINQEIVNICVRLFLENIEQSGRLQTNTAINQTIKQ